jgi:hypothetical protein
VERERKGGGTGWENIDSSPPLARHNLASPFRSPFPPPAFSRPLSPSCFSQGLGGGAEDERELWLHAPTLASHKSSSPFSLLPLPGSGGGAEDDGWGDGGKEKSGASIGSEDLGWGEEAGDASYDDYDIDLSSLVVPQQVTSRGCADAVEWIKGLDSGLDQD